MLLQLPDDPPLLQLVDFDHRRQELKVVAGVAGQLLEGGDVFGEARTPVTDAGPEELGPIRRSRPIPSATNPTSAPTSSHTLAISLMNEIFVARKAFDAYLIILAEVTSARTTGAPSSRGASRLGRRPRPEGPDDDPVGPHEVGDGGPFGEKLGIRDVVDLRSPRASSHARSRSPVPGGTVLFITSTSPSVASGSSSITCHTALRSASPE